MAEPIPIRNIYYLLCYAWNRLDEGAIVDVSGVDTTELADLFATVLIGGVHHLTRRGLDQGPPQACAGRCRNGCDAVEHRG